MVFVTQSAHLPSARVLATLALERLFDVVNIGFAVRATPGNVGVFQAVYAATAAAFGLDQNQAIAVAVLIQAQQILPVTLIGVALTPAFAGLHSPAAGARD